MTFQIFWFILIAVLWTGFFVLEGFDFGVGMLKGVVGRTDEERRVALNTIGPLWDGNEVWLIVAGAGMFAAFPEWYATMFSAFYLALVLLLVALIVRGVSFEYRGKRDSARWRGGWDLVSGLGSLLAPMLIGIALGDLLVGLPIDSSLEYTGSFWNLLTPYGVFTGITLMLLCVLHGATFLSLKATGEVRERSGVTARRVAPPVALVVLAWFLATQLTINEGVIPGLIPVSSVLAVIAVVWLLREHREGWAFAMTTFAMACTVLSIFIDLYPRVMVSSTSTSNSLTVQNAAAGAYALKVMTVVAIIFLPLVLLYQGWTYYVFRRRVSVSDLEGASATTPRATAAVGPPGSGGASPPPGE
jgi:cytochrome d ubiquinol oxidase subunit II